MYERGGRARQPIRGNQVGYLPGAVKRITFIDGGPRFALRDPDSGARAFRGTARRVDSAGDSREVGLWVADFSALRRPGTYRFECSGSRATACVEISSTALDTAMSVCISALHGARCGTGVCLEHDGYRFEHPACHTEDAADCPGERHPSAGAFVGGWHDAGDYGKYVTNGAFAVALLLKAWEHHEATLRESRPLPRATSSTPSALPPILEEARWELAWLLSMQRRDGAVFHKLTSERFCALAVPPHRDHASKRVAPVGSEATAALAAVAAQATRVFAPFDPSLSQACRRAASAAVGFLTRHPWVVPDLSGFSTGGYLSGARHPFEAWALAEWWETSGDDYALALLTERIPALDVEAPLAWNTPQLLGIATYLGSKRESVRSSTGRELRSRVVDAAEACLGNAQQHAYGRGLGRRYFWGSNGAVASSSVLLRLGHELTRQADYADAVSLQVDHLFGRNAFGRCWVTALGNAPPRRPHHRPSIAEPGRRPWPGLLVGGPSGSTKRGPRPPALTWNDDHRDFETNEVSIGWNAALVYALATTLSHETQRQATR